MKNVKFYSLLFLIVALGVYTVYQNEQKPKIGVVDFKQLIMDYDGMNEAMVSYEEKMKGWEHRSDSLQNILRVMINDLETNEYPDNIVISKENNLRAMNNYLIQENEAIAMEAQEEDTKMTTAVIDQVMEFVDDYATENDYDIIYGRNDGNYVLYKSNQYDLTEEVLTELNASYNGG